MDECQKALAVLQGPDPYSRTKENDGRRVREVEGGWVVLNHGKYRDKMSKQERADYQATWQKEYRYRKKNLKREAKSAGATRAIADGFEESECSTRNTT